MGGHSTCVCCSTPCTFRVVSTPASLSTISCLHILLHRPLLSDRQYRMSSSDASRAGLGRCDRAADPICREFVVRRCSCGRLCPAAADDCCGFTIRNWIVALPLPLGSVRKWCATDDEPIPACRGSEVELCLGLASAEVDWRTTPFEPGPTWAPSR